MSTMFPPEVIARRVARKEGAAAFTLGTPIRECPYPKGSDTSGAWRIGWALEKQAATRQLFFGE